MLCGAFMMPSTWKNCVCHAGIWQKAQLWRQDSDFMIVIVNAFSVLRDMWDEKQSRLSAFQVELGELSLKQIRNRIPTMWDLGECREIKGNTMESPAGELATSCPPFRPSGKL